MKEFIATVWIVAMGGLLLWGIVWITMKDPTFSIAMAILAGFIGAVSITAWAFQVIADPKRVSTKRRAP